MAKLSFETAVDVAAPVEVVYGYVADFPRHVEWNHQPQKMIPLTEGPVRVGSQYQTHEVTASNMPFGQKLMFAVMTPVMKMMYGAKGYTVAEVTALEPNERVAWKAWAPTAKEWDLMRMKWEVRFEPNGGTTKVVQSCEMAPPDESPAARMLNEKMAQQGKEEAGTNLRRLKSIVEARVTDRAGA